MTTLSGTVTEIEFHPDDRFSASVQVEIPPNTSHYELDTERKGRRRSKHIENLYVDRPQFATLLLPLTSTGFYPDGNSRGKHMENSGKQNPKMGLKHAQMDSCALESELHALERVPAEGWGKPTRFIPIRFVFTNKLSKDDKLLLALDAFMLSKSLKREISIGKIVHGDEHTMLNVKTSAMTNPVHRSGRG
jgi:hypothetical protein